MSHEPVTENPPTPELNDALFWYFRKGYRYALRYKLWAKWADLTNLGIRRVGKTDFVPGEKLWIRSHYINAVREFLEFARPCLTGRQELLDVGCGDSLLTYGLLRLPWKQVVGLDIVDEEYKQLSELPNRIRRAGFSPPGPDEIARFEHVAYDGHRFPFENQRFDWVFSWSAFEHIADVREVLAEMRRVVKPDGFAFIQVSPWYHTRTGSHLVDYVDEPWFQLKWSHAEVEQALRQVAEERPEQVEFILHHMWPEYRSLNRYSADMFYADVKMTGWTVAKAKLFSNTEDLRQAAPDAAFSELMIEGTYMVLQPV